MSYFETDEHAIIYANLAVKPWLEQVTHWPSEPHFSVQINGTRVWLTTEQAAVLSKATDSLAIATGN